MAKRHGHEDGSMTLGARRVAVRRTRMCTADDKHELPVQSYEYCRCASATVKRNADQAPVSA